MLKLHEIEVKYGGVKALKKANIHIPQGKVITILGANGAGKSSLMQCVSGLTKPVSGSIKFMDEIITNLATDQRVKRGIVYVPEGRRIFPRLTVEENLKMGSFAVKDRAKVSKKMEKVYQYFSRLKARANQSGGSLSGGEQQMLAIGRGLMSEPKLLMLDEPSLGLAPIIVQEIYRIIQEINSEGMTILLVEQNAHMALKVAHFGYVLELVKVLLEGETTSLTQNEDIKRLYLG